tara:strand:+ start:108 stop:485 length:378 start_codon:yes stop_codon:yes gene_type:complete
MAKNHLSVRLAPDLKSYVSQQAKKLGVTQASIVASALKQSRGNITKEMALEHVSNTKKMAKGGTISTDDMEVLKALGVGTLSGIAGYHIAGYVREQMDKDEDKGTQLLIGLITGLMGTYLYGMKK